MIWVTCYAIDQVVEIINKYEPDETNVKEKQLSKVTPGGCKINCQWCHRCCGCCRCHVVDVVVVNMKIIVSTGGFGEIHDVGRQCAGAYGSAWPLSGHGPTSLQVISLPSSMHCNGLFFLGWPCAFLLVCDCGKRYMLDPGIEKDSFIGSRNWNRFI